MKNYSNTPDLHMTRKTGHRFGQKMSLNTQKYFEVHQHARCIYDTLQQKIRDVIYTSQSTPSVPPGGVVKYLLRASDSTHAAVVVTGSLHLPPLTGACPATVTNCVPLLGESLAVCESHWCTVSGESRTRGFDRVVGRCPDRAILR